MRQKFISLCVAVLMAIADSYGGVTITVPDVNISQGGTSNVVIYFDSGTQAYTAYQFDIAYPEGIKSVSDDEGNPAFQKGDIYVESHSVSSIYTGKGLDRFQCFSVSSVPFKAQSGVLLILPIKAQKSLAEGTYQATISPIEFVLTDATPDRPDAITFNINVSKSIVLDEESTIAPSAATDVDVIVKRTLKADEWNTICLPFAMTGQQVEAAFGDDAEVADFCGYETEDDGSGNITHITVNFLTLNPADGLMANHPYIIKVSKELKEFSVDGVDIIPENQPKVAVVERTRRQWSELIGTYVANTTVPAMTLFLSGNNFYYSTGKTKMMGFRAYFDFYDVLTSVDEAYGANLRFVIIDPATGIKTVKSTGCAGGVFNLQGIYLGEDKDAQSLPKGIYVINGRQVIVK